MNFFSSSDISGLLSIMEYCVIALRSPISRIFSVRPMPRSLYKTVRSETLILFVEKPLASTPLTSRKSIQNLECSPSISDKPDSSFERGASP